jgi:hypothetical protein
LRLERQNSIPVWHRHFPRADVDRVAQTLLPVFGFPLPFFSASLRLRGELLIFRSLAILPIHSLPLPLPLLSLSQIGVGLSDVILGHPRFGVDFSTWISIGVDFSSSARRLWQHLSHSSVQIRLIRVYPW